MGALVELSAIFDKRGRSDLVVASDPTLGDRVQACEAGLFDARWFPRMFLIIDQRQAKGGNGFDNWLELIRTSSALGWLYPGALGRVCALRRRWEVDLRPDDQEAPQIPILGRG